MAIRKGAVVGAIVVGAALGISGTTNASTGENCDTASSWTSSGSECADYKFSSKDEDYDKGHDKGHDDDYGKGGDDHGKGGDKGYDKDRGKGHDKEHKHYHKHEHKHHHKHEHKHHHKHQVHKKPHGGVETGDGSLAALL
ncbi:hypothetical protein [Saccharomonospora viridis]|uniref:hypothetical protein n=1 Tax=Saccharomonospora viridis TaxID=1852 RepID=UPI0023EFB7C1|nr:hypothetical protein [Saccharomonospora viridis]